MNKYLWIVLVCFLNQNVLSAGLSSIENRISDNAAKQSKPALLFLKKIVTINSGTDNLTGVYQVGEIVREQLKQLGFKTKWVKEPASMHKASTLIAERKGTSGKRVLLIGHLDTVFPRGSHTNQFKIENNIARGQGVLDAKGGIVVMVAALKALQQAQALDNTSITIVLTGDEEDSGKPTSISRKPLIDAASHSDIALDFEPSITKETATIARRGITLWTIKSHGNESHSATIFQKNVGAGAIFELSRMLNTMRAEWQGEKYLSFNPGIIVGGTKMTYDSKTAQATAFGKENVVSKTALAKGDIRFIDVDQENAMKKKMLKLASQHLPETESHVSFLQGIPAMPPTSNNKQLLQIYSDVSVDLNYGQIKPLDPGIRGAGDISHVAAIVPANLSGLGPLGIGSHSVIEAMYIDSIPMQTQRAAVLIYRLTH